ncbi:cell division cycle-associated protein 7-like [Phalaenopsis equestris]|uniref:cell division cycle-associated protein 7-like n=1 Tax=Phalaenopsis equestris TaxID=78828 RepID=UPI0009E3EAC7|nr:cell division cycle-associated protein 7-like [Phalaenopsis equestris]
MLTSRKRSLPAQIIAEGGGDAMESVYEKSRSERIKENMERMKKLGILNLKSEICRSSNLKPVCTTRAGRPSAPSPASTPRRSTRTRSLSAPSLTPSLRRSSRLRNVAPVCYHENGAERQKDPLADDSSDLIEGRREEVYNEEHEKLLGSCEMGWTLFVDGYDNSGKRIYDQVKGKTCHQCRQKTLGRHTSCMKCNLVQGQFCGDCLYMRYGENVLEVQKNPSWICPVCRGICNCSFCRIKKGWAPTGPLYRKVRNLGHKSVAHYLILTRRVNSANKEYVEPNSPKKSQSSIDAELAAKPETAAMEEEDLEQTGGSSSKSIEAIDVLYESDDHIVISNVGEVNEATTVLKAVRSVS